MLFTLTSLWGRWELFIHLDYRAIFSAHWRDGGVHNYKLINNVVLFLPATNTNLGLILELLLSLIETDYLNKHWPPPAFKWQTWQLGLLVVCCWRHFIHYYHCGLLKPISYSILWRLDVGCYYGKVDCTVSTWLWPGTSVIRPKMTANCNIMTYQF